MWHGKSRRAINQHPQVNQENSGRTIEARRDWIDNPVTRVGGGAREEGERGEEEK